MPNGLEESVSRMLYSSHHLLADAQRLSESMRDQSLADDLLTVSMELLRVLRAFERTPYRSPLSDRP